VAEWDLISEGDRILVAMSGGKDSYALLSILDLLRRRAPVGFELVAWHLDQEQPGYDGAPLRTWLEAWGGEFVIAEVDTYSVVTEKTLPGKTYCSLCSRLRRGVMYNAAVALRCNKIALGHHADDSIETLMLNLLYAGQLRAMPAWLRSDDGRNQVIRPLITTWEADLVAYAVERDFPLMPCDLCGSQDGLQRQAVKALIASLEQRKPGVRKSIFAALSNTRPSHLLDKRLHGLLENAAP
jgi:tRNA 2-thiocytidine biosynthesis protein TtcA